MIYLGLLVTALVLALFWYLSQMSGKSATVVRSTWEAVKPTKDGARSRLAAKKKEATIKEMLALTDQTFVVADIETTGLNRLDDDIIELAAVLVGPQGRILAEFSTLIKTGSSVPSEITKLTGITTKDLETKGRPLGTSLKSFLGFIGEHPVFFHNASFDKGFIQEAVRQTQPRNTARPGAYSFEAGVYDTLPLARAAWPNLPNHKLTTLAKLVNAPQATHRALADVRALLAVMLAAKKTLQPQARATEPVAGQTATALAG